MTADILPSVAVWLSFIAFGPDAVGAVLYVIHESDLFDPIRGYIEARYPGSKLEYLINCPFCLSYWISLFISALFILICIFGSLFNSSKALILLLGVFTFLCVAGRQVERIKGPIK